ncbi:nucleotidyltransferase [Cyanobacterium aponinum FACHB-4101]|uniref:DNA polymerase beta domain protein region n=2 Tax=Cyanobacterium aponinum TaxID=379064 RepID=K9Z5Y0_CYAAP|nr:nucleotidyltransferase [Cyanobacterium aponinum]AFZ53980.1 DNA polymerase beta domain protein region [Cyanobacterium aponinum PCC 10605]MBD2395166.1 nucleotidyltransferase [Cyanobacterium aponinum FACHB-4101]MTF39529.1 nucleotidyltransferase [Cyanobacterium aponinum 0216]
MIPNKNQINISHHAISQLCQKYHIKKLALFGSVLRDDFTSQSDIDILVEFIEGKTPGFRFIEIQDKLTQLLGRTVDLNTAQDLSCYFRDEVVNNAQVIYEKN